MHEYFDVLDENGRKTGAVKLRSEVHQDGDWHKTVHIWIVNQNKDILLQKRSPDKDSFPNMWDISCAGHLEAGDTPLKGALRELLEELGIAVKETDLQLIGSTKNQSKYASSFINNELSDVYLLPRSLDVTALSFQKKEISEIKYVSLVDFKLMIKKQDPTLLMHPEEFEILLEALDALI